MAAAQVLYENTSPRWFPMDDSCRLLQLDWRELAGTRRLVEDDIKARLRDADQRGLAKRRIRLVEEMTSRKAGTDIPRILERLEAVFKSAEIQRATEQKEGKQTNTPVPYDVVLATNMISVGVDIDRLGLMLVAGQPKNTVGVHSGNEPRWSHCGWTWFGWHYLQLGCQAARSVYYERFEHYHDTFFKHVEALSVTPFIARALDRGLSGVLVALMRLSGYWHKFNANLKAGALQDTDPRMAFVFSQLAQRSENATHDVSVRRRRYQLDRRRDEWLSRVHNQKEYHLGYQSEGGATVALLEHLRQRLGDVHLSRFTKRCGRHNGSYTRPALHRADGRMRESR